MKKIFLIIIVISAMLTGCIETCDTAPEIYFKPVNSQGKVVVGTNGVYNTDSLRLFYQLVQGNDTSFIDNTNMPSFHKSDSIFSINTSSQGKAIFLLQYDSNDLDTLSFNIIENKKRQPMCVDITFTYNGVTICSACDFNTIHSIVKK